NHLDIDNKEVLENALIDYQGTLLFVSHDRYFINRIANKVIELSPEGSKLYLGDYDYYLEKKREEEELAELLAKEETPVAEPKKKFYQDKEQQKLIRSLKRKIEAIEENLSNLDEKIDLLETQMSQSDILNDHVQLLELTNELEAKKAEQEEQLASWEELSMELEEFE
ncbi:MAG: multidrug ABC transporter ATP-binding protein, partial [Enterococcus sp.]